MKFAECSHCQAQLIPESIYCPHCGEPQEYSAALDLRCECGFLLCKLTEDALEIKCRRCKRLVYIPVPELPGRFADNKEKMKQWAEREAREPRRPEGESRGQYCAACGQYKPNVVYGKCLDCRTETIKITYKSRNR